jgi:hypothetical protein
MVVVCMVRDADKRARKFADKIDADVLAKQTSLMKPSMVKHQSLYMSVVADLETKIKKLVEAEGVTTLKVRDYLNYGRELLDLSRRFSATTLLAEAQAKADKWQTRGLDSTILTDIASLFGLPLTLAESYGEHFPPFWKFKLGASYYSLFALATTSVTSGSQTDKTVKAVPFFFPRKMRFDRIGVNVSSYSLAPILTFDVWSDTGDLYPNRRLISLGDLTVTKNYHAYKTIDLTLEKGLYWVSHLRKGTGNLTLRGQYFWLPLQGLTVDSITNNVGYTYLGSLDYVPDPFPLGISADTILWHIWLRLAEVF